MNDKWDVLWYQECIDKLSVILLKKNRTNIEFSDENKYYIYKFSDVNKYCIYDNYRRYFFI